MKRYRRGAQVRGGAIGFGFHHGESCGLVGTHGCIPRFARTMAALHDDSMTPAAA